MKTTKEQKRYIEKLQNILKHLNQKNIMWCFDEDGNFYPREWVEEKLRENI